MYSFVSGDQNHGSPMMQQNMRSQTPGMNPVPNSQQGMGQPRMVGPQGNVSQYDYSFLYHNKMIKQICLIFNFEKKKLGKSK